MNIFKKAIEAANKYDATFSHTTPKFRKPVPAPPPNMGYQPITSTISQPPNAGSGVQLYSSCTPSASIEISCTYKTPCGWCIKWDKKCDEKPYKRGLRVNINPIDDAIDKELMEKEYNYEFSNK